MRFKYHGSGPHLLADTGKVVEPEEVIETDIAINHPDFEALDAKDSKPTKEAK